MDPRLEQDALIEDALKSQPLAPMPRSITANVMSRIQAVPSQQRPMLVTWNDFVLSLFIALSIGAVLFALQSLPPVAVVKLQIQWILLYQDFIVNARWLLPALSFGLAAFFAALTIPTLVQMVSNRQ
ncbi:MAG TPA: hypothetical protein PLL38_17970 [Anaerolineales bacterium]|nr:hypothetical protein [Anaerolineales bacterium]